MGIYVIDIRSVDGVISMFDSPNVMLGFTSIPVRSDNNIETVMNPRVTSYGEWRTVHKLVYNLFDH